MKKRITIFHQRPKIVQIPAQVSDLPPHTMFSLYRYERCNDGSFTYECRYLTPLEMIKREPGDDGRDEMLFISGAFRGEWFYRSRVRWDKEPEFNDFFYRCSLLGGLFFFRSIHFAHTFHEVTSAFGPDKLDEAKQP